MKKALNWLLNAAMIMIVGAAVAPLVLGVLFFILLFIASNTGMLDGLSRNVAAVDALDATHLAAYTKHAPYYSATVDDCMTIFEIAEYDNHVDNTDLRAGLMALAAGTDGWHVESVSAADYAARIPAEAAFLLPDVTFDARFESADDMAFFDQESGLFVHLHKGEMPKPGTVRADKLTVPHNGYVYTMETHGGFHGDGSTFYALIIPEEKRVIFEETLNNPIDWHKGMVTHTEYAELLHFFYECPELLPSDDLVFDQWCYVDTYARAHPNEAPDRNIHPRFPAVMQEVGAHFSQNWLVALYDADTGLFIYYQYDS